jgi:integrase
LEAWRYLAPGLLHYQRAHLKEKASPRSINIEIALVCLVLRDAKLWQNIAGDVKMLEEESDIGRELSDDEAIRLLTACKASASRSLYPGVLVSIHTGLRSHEMRLLRWRQVDLDKGTITVGKSKTKGGKGRLVYLSETAIQTLKNWKAQFPDAKPNHAVFPSEAYAMKGKKGTPGGIVASYQTDPNTPIGSWKRSWATAKKAAGVEALAGSAAYGRLQDRGRRRDRPNSDGAVRLDVPDNDRAIQPRPGRSEP